MLRIVKNNNLPGFSLSVREGSGEPLIHMLRRQYAGEGISQVHQPNTKREVRASQPHQIRTASSGDLPLLSPIMRELSERTISRIRNDFPGWDIYALKAEFDEWINEDQTRKPHDYEAAFYGFVRQHHHRNRYQLA
jgi:hypothetical protein